MEVSVRDTKAAFLLASLCHFSSSAVAPLSSCSPSSSWQRWSGGDAVLALCLLGCSAYQFRRLALKPDMSSSSQTASPPVPTLSRAGVRRAPYLRIIRSPSRGLAPPTQSSPSLLYKYFLSFSYLYFPVFTNTLLVSFFHLSSC